MAPSPMPPAVTMAAEDESTGHAHTKIFITNELRRNVHLKFKYYSIQQMWPRPP